MVKETLIKGLIMKWGLEKFIKVVAVSILGAGISGLLAESRIPNDPELREESKGEE